MKHLIICLTTLFAMTATGASLFAQDDKEEKKEEKKIELNSVNDKVSYGIGMQIGQNLKRQGLDLDPKILAKGISDAFSGEEPLLSQTAIQFAMQEFQQELVKKQKEKAAKAKEAGTKYLAENKKKKGVTTTKSGLQYEVLKKGSGPSPKATDTVSTHYHGTLVDGTVFDSSVARGTPATFPVNGVIKGWTEALQLMKVGDKWKLAVPSDLAYGETGRPPTIAPDTVLIFEVELLEINPEQK